MGESGRRERPTRGRERSWAEPLAFDTQGDRNLPYTRRRQTSAPSHTRLGSFWRRTKHHARTFLRKLNEFLTVPMYSALLSIFIALIPPLQRLLNEAKPLTQAIKSAGQCSSRCPGIPVVEQAALTPASIRLLQSP